MRDNSYPRVRAVGTALPEHYADQASLTGTLRSFWQERGLDTRLFDRLQRAVRVSGRFLAYPIERYVEFDSFAKSNRAWIEAAPELGKEAIRGALATAGLSAKDVDHFFLVSVTGIATPSIDARIINALGMKSSIKRTPIFGLGCVGGAASIARAADYVRAFPSEVSLLLSVELCSLTLQRDDLSPANMIASGLFGDGAAAVVIDGGEREGSHCPQVIATQSVFYPETEQMMGWEIVESGFKIVLDPAVPDLICARLGCDVDRFLNRHGLSRADIDRWIAHTGGPKVLRAMETSLQLPPDALKRSWRSLDEVGNLSSASVLFVLKELLESGEAEPGDNGLLVAMGPGFCCELVLLQW